MPSLFQSRWISLLFAACFAAAAALPLPAVAQAARAETLARAEQSLPQAQANTGAHARDRARSPQAWQVQLSAVAAAKLATEKRIPRPGAPRKVGFSRTIPGLANSANLNWKPTAEGGQIAAVSVVSPGALGLRLGVLVRRLPPQALLRFYAQGSSEVSEATGQSILAGIARNRAAGDASVDAATYWAPHIDGAEATLEIELPAGVPTNTVDIAIPRLSHMTEPRATSVMRSSQYSSQQFSQHSSQRAAPVASAATSGACELDVMCYPAWNKESNATALMQFVKAGEAFVCSGTLLNSVPATQTPYFLSAYHCISDQTTASSLQTLWFYHDTACNSGLVNPSYLILNGGAALLYAAAGTDTSFLWLDSVPPGGAVFAGWQASVPVTGTPVASVHHPNGDLQKISFGGTTDFDTCTTSAGTDTFTCNPASQNTANHIEVGWNQGTVEPGSSGSGLFVTNNANGGHYLVGQLHGGTASCSNTTGSDYYGRFDVAYNASLSKWLSASNIDTVTVGISGPGGVSSAPGGIQCGNSAATCTASFPAGTSVTLTATPVLGGSFTGWGGACSGTNPVCTLTLNANAGVNAIFSAQAVMPQAGYWWNPAEPGRGYVIEVQGSSLFFAPFFYANLGQATWADSSGQLTTPQMFTGPINTFSGGQTLTGPYKPATQSSTSLGTANLNFSSNSTGTLTWPGGTVPIQRFDFGPGGAAAAQPSANPQTGYWYNPAEGGRGFTIEVQGGLMYLAGYMYDSSGLPIWYLSTGTMNGSTLYTGTWQQFGNGQTLTGGFRAASIVNSNVGSVTVQFSSQSSATMTLPDGRQIPLTRFMFGSSATPPSIAGQWNGTWQWTGPTSNGACTVNDGGAFSMTIAQSGNFFSAPNVNATGIQTVNADCSSAGAIVANGGTATGTLSGNNMSISFNLPTAGGSTLLFTGTATYSNGVLTGNIVRSTGGAGTFSIKLQ